MSVGQTSAPENSSQPGSESVPSLSDAPGVTPGMVQATRDEIHQLKREIVQLSTSSVEPERFHGEFLQRVVAALASVAGATWLCGDDGALRAAARINLDAVLADPASPSHLRIIQQVVGSQQPLVIPPGAKQSGAGITNPTNWLLILVPLRVDERVLGVIEVFQRPNRGPATERGYLRFLVEMTERAIDYLRTQHIQQLAAGQEWSNQLETFVAEIHRTLSVRAASYAVVNEARRLLGCDRVSLAVGTGRQCRLTVVSGLDSIDRRAQQVRQLGRLASLVLQTGESLWLGNDARDLPPQIEMQWNRYVDISHVRRCVILPMHSPRDEKDQPISREPFGALIVEQLRDGLLDEPSDGRLNQITKHSSAAISNALEHEDLPLLPVWRALKNTCEALGGRYFVRTLLAVILSVATALALTTMQSDLSLSVRGTVQPVLRRTVFAREDGVITNVTVAHGQTVRSGQVLVEMRNTDLEVEISSLAGRQTAIREQMLSLQRSLLDDPRLGTAQQNRLSGELMQLEQLAASMQQQLALLHRKEQQLTVRVDRDGQVVTWHVRDRLLHRPVQQGEALMAIVDPTGEWELELYVPEKHVGHLISSSTHAEASLPVTFVLSSHADQRFEGRIVQIDPVAVMHDEFGNSVRVRVAIDKLQLPELRTDASVTARVYCGRRSLGYAWFHDLIDAVRTRIMFWL